MLDPVDILLLYFLLATNRRTTLPFSLDLLLGVVNAFALILAVELLEGIHLLFLNRHFRPQLGVSPPVVDDGHNYGGLTSLPVFGLVFDRFVCGSLRFHVLFICLEETM